MESACWPKRGVLNHGYLVVHTDEETEVSRRVAARRLALIRRGRPAEIAGLSSSLQQHTKINTLSV
jgi:hypothetical protein